jgi:putative ABC transport system permease protein
MSWLDDVRVSFRALIKNPGFTAVAIATLAIGIGVNAAVFTVTNAALFRGFSYIQRNDRILYMSSYEGCCVSYPDFLDWRAQAKSFEGMGIVHGIQAIFSDKTGFPEYYFATEVSSNTFKLIGHRPILGRDFIASDEIPGAPAVAILSYAFWERRYGKDPGILGRTARMNGVPTTVVGVMPQGFFFPQNQDFWLPLVPTPNAMKRENRETWYAFGRLKAGVTVESARAEMETIGRRLEIAYPLTDKGFLPKVRNFHEFYIGPNARLIYESLWGAVGFVLLIACANLANLLLGRAIGRSREISVRIALGAGRWRIIRQLLIESVMLSGLGGLFGWWIAKLSVSTYELAAKGAPGYSWFDHVLDYSMDWRIFAYLVAISIGTGLLFGLAPAIRLSKLDVNAMLKDASRGATGGGHGKSLPGLLVIAEMALAVVLLAGAGVMIRSFMNTYSADLGVKTENILMAAVGAPTESKISFYDRLIAGLESIPGVESVAIATHQPAGGSMKLAYELDGAPPASDRAGVQRPQLSAVVISPAYFRTLGAPVLSGREFSDADQASGPQVAIVNQRFVSTHWPGENPLGKRLRLFDGQKFSRITVVGVAPDIVQNDRNGQRMDPVVYLPYRQKPIPGMYFIARTRGAPGSLATTVRNEIHALYPDLPVYGPLTLTAQLRPRYWNRGLYGSLFLIFAAIALLLASIGLYAVIAQSVSQRTQEIGIRMAIGATARDIRGLVLKQGLFPMGIGWAIGLAASFGVNRLLASELVQVSPGDPVTLIFVSAVLVLSATLGCLIPARRAMRVDPLVALRHE